MNYPFVFKVDYLRLCPDRVKTFMFFIFVANNFVHDPGIYAYGICRVKQWFKSVLSSVFLIALCLSIAVYNTSLEQVKQDLFGFSGQFTFMVVAMYALIFHFLIWLDKDYRYEIELRCYQAQLKTYQKLGASQESLENKACLFAMFIKHRYKKCTTKSEYQVKLELKNIL